MIFDDQARFLNAADGARYIDLSNAVESDYIEFGSMGGTAHHGGHYEDPPSTTYDPAVNVGNAGLGQPEMLTLWARVQTDVTGGAIGLSCELFESMESDFTGELRVVAGPQSVPVAAGTVFCNIIVPRISKKFVRVKITVAGGSITGGSVEAALIMQADGGYPLA